MRFRRELGRDDHGELTGTVILSRGDGEGSQVTQPEILRFGQDDGFTPYGFTATRSMWRSGAARPVKPNWR